MCLVCLMQLLGDFLGCRIWRDWCNIALRGRRVWWLAFDFLAGLIAVLRCSASICG